MGTSVVMNNQCMSQCVEIAQASNHLHIHAGMGCTSDALGHYWNTTSISDDPGKTISYNAFDSLVFGTMAFNYNVEVVTGLSNFNTLGHTLIVHDYTGAR